jgi:hypothetical protein
MRVDQGRGRMTRSMTCTTPMHQFNIELLLRLGPACLAGPAGRVAMRTSMVQQEYTDWFLE